MTRLSASQRMHAAADRMAGAVDHARDTERQKALQSAAETRAAHIAAFPCQTKEEAVRVLRALARETYHRLSDLMGPLETACLFESLARRSTDLRSVGGRAAARAEAEKVFAANDRGEGS